MEENIGSVENRKELYESARTLTGLLLSKLKEDMKEKVIDQAQIRLTSAITLRALKLWEKISRDDTGSGKSLERDLKILTGETARVLENSQSEGGRD